MTLRSTLLAFLIALLSVAPASLHAQEPKQGVWRYVDATTLAIVRLDLTTFDRPAMEKWVMDIVNANTDPKTAADIQAALRTAGPHTAAEQLKQAGVKDLTLVLSLADIPNSVGHLLVPLPAGADPAKIARTLFLAISLMPDEQPRAGTLLSAGSLFAIVIDNTLIISAGEPARFTNFPAADRPDLVQALAATKNAAIAVAQAPSEDTRRVIEAMMPTLPPPANVPSTVLTRGSKYAYLTATFPPNPSLNVHIQSDNAEPAQKLHALLTQLLNVARNDAGFRRDVPAADQIIDAITPKLAGDHLTLSLDPAATDRVVTLFATGLTKARENAMQVQSMSNLRQIGLGIHMYASENKGAFPDSLEQTSKYFGQDPAIAKRVFTNPLHPDRNPAYIYLKPKGLLKDTGPETALAYDSFDQWPGKVAVLFADGHVETISDQNRFNQLIDKAKAPKP